LSKNSPNSTKRTCQRRDLDIHNHRTQIRETCPTTSTRRHIIEDKPPLIDALLSWCIGHLPFPAYRFGLTRTLGSFHPLSGRTTTRHTTFPNAAFESRSNDVGSYPSAETLASCYLSTTFQRESLTATALLVRARGSLSLRSTVGQTSKADCTYKLDCHSSGTNYFDPARFASSFAKPN
jgi:hypothetical protein